MGRLALRQRHPPQLSRGREGVGRMGGLPCPSAPPSVFAVARPGRSRAHGRPTSPFGAALRLCCCAARKGIGRTGGHPALRYRSPPLQSRSRGMGWGACHAAVVVGCPGKILKGSGDNVRCLLPWVLSKERPFLHPQNPAQGRGKVYRRNAGASAIFTIQRRKTPCILPCNVL